MVKVWFYNKIGQGQLETGNEQRRPISKLQLQQLYCIFRHKKKGTMKNDKNKLEIPAAIQHLLPCSEYRGNDQNMIFKGIVTMQPSSTTSLEAEPLSWHSSHTTVKLLGGDVSKLPWVGITKKLL